MSATGNGGVTVIAGQNFEALTPVTIPNGQTLTFTHNLGRRAFQVLVLSSPSGALVTSGITIAQATANAITVQNTGGAPITVIVTCRWEVNTTELDLILTNAAGTGTSDSRVVIA